MTFDLTDAENLGRQDAQEGEPVMDLRTFAMYTHRPLGAVFLENGQDTLEFAYRVYRAAYKQEN